MIQSAAIAALGILWLSIPLWVIAYYVSKGRKK